MILRKAKHLTKKSVIILQSSAEAGKKEFWAVLDVKKDAVFVKGRIKHLTDGTTAPFSFFDDDFVEVYL